MAESLISVGPKNGAGDIQDMEVPLDDLKGGLRCPVLVIAAPQPSQSTLEMSGGWHGGVGAGIKWTVGNFS